MTNNQKKSLKKAHKLVDKINELDTKFSQMSNAELKGMTNIFKDRLEKGETLDDLLVEAFATVREASDRVLGMKHYDVQLIGGIMLHKGKIAEMKTGEGKTLVATLAAYLNALTGKGVHVVTVNEYLSKRDKEQMEKVYSFLGLTVGVILSDQSSTVKRLQYACDITYGTNNEFGFDYLRDNRSLSSSEKVQKELNFAIVDEVDSILIDEARTPLIISAPSEEPSALYIAANQFVKSLNVDDYEHDEKKHTINLTDTGITKAQKFYGVDEFMDNRNILIQHHTIQALRAHKVMKKESDYIVKDGKIIIVDDFTGRLMHGRTYSDGLHQAIEAKEGVTIQDECQTLATITFQNFFRLYDKLSGMTGTAKTEEEEFKSIYNLNVIQIPTNKPIQRIDHKDKVYLTKEEKLDGIVNEIIKRYELQQPILIGTISIESSEILSERLTLKNIKHNVLNAKQHDKEANIIAQAGRLGAVTIATNMAGRGTDIIIGGNADLLAKDILRTEFKYTDDEIASIDSTEFKTEEEVAVCENFKRVKEHLKAVIDDEYEKVMRAGGLCVIGTERHESRRIDNQLRGRSGRQGDTGESIFYLSLEDDLLRIFGGDKIKKITEIFNLEPGTHLDNKTITKNIENSQKKVEGINFGIRKQVVKYDDVLNEQRVSIYKFRSNILDSSSLEKTIYSMMEDLSEEILFTLIESFGPIKNWNKASIDQELKSKLAIKSNVGLDNLKKLDKNKFVSHINNVLQTEYHNVVAMYGKEYIENYSRTTLLRLIDSMWIEHIDALTALKEGIHLRSIGQEDPVVAYRIEGSRMFDTLTLSIAISLLVGLFSLQN